MSTDDLVDAFAAKIKAFGVPILPEDNTLRFALFESKLPKRLPASFASFLSRHRFPSLMFSGSLSLDGSRIRVRTLWRRRPPKGSLSELLLPNGCVQVGQLDTGSFDAVCFDLNQKSQNRECQIVQIDHEDILSNWEVRVSAKLWPSFVKFMESTISATHAGVH